MKHLILVFFALTSLQLFSQEMAVVIVDMQESYFNPERDSKVKTDYFNELVEKQIELLEWAADNDINNVLVFELTREGRTIEPLRNVIESKFENYRYVKKLGSGGFDSYNMMEKSPAKTLDEWGVDSIIITGIHGPYCVNCTVEGAIENHLEVYTTADLVADFVERDPVYPDRTWWGKFDVQFEAYKSLGCLKRFLGY